MKSIFSINESKAEINKRVIIEKVSSGKIKIFGKEKNENKN
jgi:hypothetical protein